MRSGGGVRVPLLTQTAERPLHRPPAALVAFGPQHSQQLVSRILPWVAWQLGSEEGQIHPRQCMLK
jgi:hypothetical protein